MCVCRGPGGGWILDTVSSHGGYRGGRGRETATETDAGRTGEEEGMRDGTEDSQAKKKRGELEDRMEVERERETETKTTRE